MSFRGEVLNRCILRVWAYVSHSHDGKNKSTLVLPEESKFEHEGGQWAADYNIIMNHSEIETLDQPAGSMRSVGSGGCPGQEACYVKRAISFVPGIQLLEGLKVGSSSSLRSKGTLLNYNYDMD